jgi:hypothetical protein
MRSLKFGLIGLLLQAGCSSTVPSAPELTDFLHVRLDTGRVGAITTAIDPRTHTIYWSWAALRDSLIDVYLARMAAGDSVPSPPVRVHPQRGLGNLHAQAPPQVRVGPDGTVYVLWSNRISVPGRRFPASNLYLARSTDGGRTFAPPCLVNDDAAGPPSSHTFHDLAIGPDGSVYVSWIDARRLDAQRANAPMHHHEAGPAGPDIRIARSLDGCTFDSSIIVDSTSCPCCRTALAVDARGTLYVAWRKVFSGNVRDIVVAVSHDKGQTFSQPVRVETDGWVLDGCPHVGPALAVDNRHQLHVAWYTGASERTGVWYRRLNPQLNPTSTAYPFAQAVPVAQVRLAWDGNQLWAAWEMPLQSQVRLQAVTQTATPDTLQALTFIGRHPTLAAVNGWVVLALTTDQDVQAYIRRPVPRV